VRIVNKTIWLTDHLRAILNRVAATELDPENRKRVVVTIGYDRSMGKRYLKYDDGRWERGGTSGFATISGTHMTVNLPAHKQTVDRIDLAHTVAHEMAHLRGMTHNQMRGSERYCRKGRWREIYSWAETFPLEKKETSLASIPSEISLEERVEKVAASLVERRLKRLAVHQEKLKEWERKFKFARTKRLYWAGRVQATEKLLKASENSPKKETLQ